MSSPMLRVVRYWTGNDRGRLELGKRGLRLLLTRNAILTSAGKPMFESGGIAALEAVIAILNTQLAKMTPPL